MLPTFFEEQLSHSLANGMIRDDFLSAPTGPPGPVFNPVSRAVPLHGLDYGVPGEGSPAGGSDPQRRLAIFQNLTLGENGST